MSDTSTRSGMLWEVERILKECKELDSLPQVLLMENVPQVHGKKNIEDFNKWINSLEEMGYKNYWQDLIATDYGVPQTRKRTFMVSILGDETYEFPKPFPLETKLKDLLEDNVDESFYLSDKQIEDVSHWNVYQKPLETMEKVDKENVSPTLTTRTGAYAAGMILVKDEYVGTYDYAQSDTLRPSEETRTHIGKETSGSLLASGNHNGLLIKNNTKKGYLEANEGDGVNICGRMKYQRGNVQKDMCQTLDTMGGDTKGVVVSNLKREMCNKLLQDGTVKENDVIRHSYTNSRMNGEMKDQKANNIAPILDTRCDCLGVVNNLRIRKLTPKECGRLMGVKDEDIDKMLINQSNASAYHIYGDGIVVNVLMEIFKEML